MEVWLYALWNASFKLTLFFWECYAVSIQLVSLRVTIESDV